MPTLSACMIVKNEEAVLDRCLKSIVDVVDEIVLVDTGSTDKTIEIAEKYGCRIFKQAWCGDFSKARNYSLSKAKMDWVLVIDADEELVNPEELLKAIEAEDGNILLVDVINLYEGATMETYVPSIRISKRDAKLKYTGVVHNMPIIIRGMTQVKVPVRINHYGYDLSPEKMEAKRVRTQTLLEEVIEKNPDDAYQLFNLAQLKRSKNGRFNADAVEEIMELCSRAAKLTNPRNYLSWSTYVMSNTLLAWGCLYAGQPDEGIRHALESHRYKANYLDNLMVLGYLYLLKKQFVEAEKWFNVYLRVHEAYDPVNETDSIILNYKDHACDAMAGLAESAEKQGQLDRAINGYMTSFRMDPTRTGAYSALTRLMTAGKLHENEWKKVEKLRPVPDEKKASYYDEIFSRPYDTSRYGKIYTAIVQDYVDPKVPVLEIGCGTGDLAAMLVEAGVHYTGFDFSRAALTEAKKKVGAKVKKGNAYQKHLYGGEYGTVIMTEVLEHVDDLKVLDLIPAGKKIIASVPSFMDAAHLRTYPGTQYITDRYIKHIKMESVISFNMGGTNVIYLFSGIKL